MPPTLTEIKKQKCDRYNELRSEIEGILSGAESRPLTAEEASACDAKQAEADKLVKDLKAIKADALRRSKLNGLIEFGETPQPLLHRLDSPGDDVAEELKKARRELMAGRYSLRNFKGPAGREAAYDAGLLMLATGNSSAREWARERCQERSLDIRALTAAPMGESGNVGGGALVFPEFEASLIVLKEQYGVIEREGYRRPMGSDTLSIPRQAGGVTVYYPDENGEITASSMKFDQVQLVAKKYAGLSLWSNELNEDAIISMVDILSGEFAYAFAKAEDTNAAVGDGTATYCRIAGLLNKFQYGTNGVIPSASVVTATGHTSLGATTLTDWESVVGTLPVYAEARAKWYMSKSAFWAGPARLADAAGGNIAAYLTSGAPLMWLGYEVVPFQAMPANSALTTGTYAALLGDMQMTCHLGTRRGITVLTSDQRYFEYDQLAIRATQRVAINNVVGDAAAPTTAAGPMICLKLG